MLVYTTAYKGNMDIRGLGENWPIKHHFLYKFCIFKYMIKKTFNIPNHYSPAIQGESAKKHAINFCMTLLVNFRQIIDFLLNFFNDPWEISPKSESSSLFIGFPKETVSHMGTMPTFDENLAKVESYWLQLTSS